MLSHAKTGQRKVPPPKTEGISSNRCVFRSSALKNGRAVDAIPWPSARTVGPSSFARITIEGYSTVPAIAPPHVRCVRCCIQLGGYCSLHGGTPGGPTARFL